MNPPHELTEAGRGLVPASLPAPAMHSLAWRAIHARLRRLQCLLERTCWRSRDRADRDEAGQNSSAQPFHPPVVPTDTPTAITRAS